MSRDLLNETKRRYARLIEAEAIVLDVYQVVGNVVPAEVPEYRKDLKSVINLLAHYKHREIHSITTLSEAVPQAEVVVPKSKVAPKVVKEEAPVIETTSDLPEDFSDDIIEEYEVVKEEEVTENPKNSPKGTQPIKLVRRTLRRRK